MLVCHCHAVTDRTIREAIREGACSADEVGAACGAGTGCGGCRDVVDGIVQGEQRSYLVPLRRADHAAEAR